MLPVGTLNLGLARKLPGLVGSGFRVDAGCSGHEAPNQDLLLGVAE